MKTYLVTCAVVASLIPAVVAGAALFPPPPTIPENLQPVIQPTPSVLMLPACPTTLPENNAPIGTIGQRNSYGRNGLWVLLFPDGIVRLRDGSMGMKFPWFRGPGARGKLAIKGRRPDAPAPPLGSIVPDGYGEIGFQSSGIIFPTPGCWEITAQVGVSRLTFVTLVVPPDAARGTPAAEP